MGGAKGGGGGGGGGYDYWGPGGLDSPTVKPPKRSSNFLVDMLNPIEMFTNNRTAGNFDPLGSITKQAVVNSMDVLQGKTGFGQHENWGGYGATGDVLNAVMGKPLKDQTKNVPFSLLDDEKLGGLLGD